MKIDLNFNLLGLDGAELLDQNGQLANAGKIIAESLVGQTKGDALKFWDWAVALNKGETLNLDSSDQETFKSFVKDNERLPILTKAQILHKLKKE